MLLILLGFLAAGECSKFAEVKVPAIVDPREEKVILECNYNLGGEQLYSVTWLKDGNEFFRYMPSAMPGKLQQQHQNSEQNQYKQKQSLSSSRVVDSPAAAAFNVHDGVVQVELSESNDKRVVIRQHLGDKWINVTGSYGCQVSGESPKFDIVYDEAVINVGILPQRDPVIENLREHYDIGETLDAQCISAPSYPTAQLSFLVNGREVEKSLTTEFPSVGSGVEGSLVSTTRLGLSMSLSDQDFTATSARSLHLVCRSILPGIPGAKARETKAIIYLSASNQKLAQEAPTPFSSRADTNSHHHYKLFLSYTVILALFNFNSVL
ncbi:GSCOCG00009676001-RA-CDS [Cotesia congregata]|nr:GSCOCG00009676001-RA-CDS [Cotesia congregata]